MLRWVLLAWVVSAGQTQQDVRVTASLSSTSVLTGATVVLEVRVETPGIMPVRVNIPPLPQSISIVGTQDFTQDQVRMPGGRTRIVQRNMILLPSRSGKFLIPTIPVEVDGTTYRTAPLELDVVAGGALPEPPRSNDDDDIRLMAALDRDTVYVGEQTLLEVEALFPRDLRQRQTRPATFETPSPSGFWLNEMPGGITGGVRMFRGDLYETQRYRRVYVPLQAGNFALDPVRLRYELRRGYLYAPENREIVSDSLRLTVLPLPEGGRPRGFTGAVGRYRATAWLQPANVAAGDAATLSIELEGTGNVKTLPPPRLPTLEGVEIFPPSEDAQVNVRGDRLGGAKRFTWVLVPEGPGEIDLGAIEYAFFDPETGSYHVARADPLKLHVAPASSADARTTADTALAPIRVARRGTSWNFVRSPLFAAAQLVPLFALFAAFAVRRRRTAPATARREVHTRWEGSLRDIATATASGRDFLSQLAAAVRVALSDITEHASLRAAPSDSIRGELEALGVSQYAATAAAALLRRIDHARFGGSGVDAPTRDRLMVEARSVLERVEAELRQNSAAGGVGLGIITLLLLLPASVTAQHADHDFRTGVNAYLRADYEGAVVAFETHLENQPADASAWYNLGNAYRGAGNTGRAVWAWRHALELSPRDLATRRNLRIAGGNTTLAGAPPPFALSRVETLLLLGALWWAGALVGAFAVLRKGRLPRRFTTGAAMLVALVLAAGAPAWLRSGTAVALEQHTPLLAGPAIRSDTVAVVPAGTPVIVVGREGNWLRIRTSDQAEGWGNPERFAEVPTS
jgi:hypothetical protein